jgi:hypothetical protein
MNPEQALANSTFRCFDCHQWRGQAEANLDAEMRLVCDACYLAHPPVEDVDGVFVEVMMHMDSYEDFEDAERRRLARERDDDPREVL